MVDAYRQQGVAKPCAGTRSGAQRSHRGSADGILPGSTVAYAHLGLAVKGVGTLDIITLVVGLFTGDGAAQKAIAATGVEQQGAEGVAAVVAAEHHQERNARGRGRDSDAETHLPHRS